MIKVILNQPKTESKEDWNNIRMGIEQPGVVSQMFALTQKQVIDLDNQLFDILLDEQNTVDREIQIGGRTVTLTPEGISAVCFETSGYVHAWAFHAFDNDWLEWDDTPIV